MGGVLWDAEDVVVAVVRAEKVAAVVVNEKSKSLGEC
jgi:hypothetical protein